MYPLGVVFWSHYAAALGGVNEVPQPYGPVSPPSQDHGVVVNDAGGQPPHTLVLVGLGNVCRVGMCMSVGRWYECMRMLWVVMKYSHLLKIPTQ